MKRFSLLLVIACLAGCYSTSKDPEKTDLEGKLFPDFTVMLQDSITFLKTSQLPMGKPIALFYFSPVCPYCRAQTEEIIDDIDKIKDINFLFITSFPIPALRRFNKEYNLEKYSNITVGIDTAHFVKDYYETVGVPYMAIYGKDKKLNKSFLGKIYSSQIKKVAAE